MDPSLSFVTLGVEDPARSRAFYEALGLVASPKSGAEVVFFQLAQGVVLALYGGHQLAAEAGLDRLPGPAVLSRNLGSREEVDSLLARAAAAGGRVTRSATLNAWGVYRGWFTDPDGHAWEIAYNARARLDERGGFWLH